MRLFLAIPLADSVLTELSHLTVRLRSALPNLRWVAPDSWHITLKFLGATTPLQYDRLIPLLFNIRSQPFPVQLAGPDSFDRTGVFFAAVDLTPQLVSLRQQVIAATASCEFAPDTCPFRPHVTLARSRGRGPKPSEFKTSIRVQPVIPSFLASEFVLYQSQLTPAGSVYQVRQRFPLGA
jgi:2'-5' RNA ligase